MSYGEGLRGVPDNAPSTRCVGLGDPDEYAVKRRVEDHLRQRRAMVDAPCGGLTAAESGEAQQQGTALGDLVDRLEKMSRRAVDLTDRVECACDRALGATPAVACPPGPPMPNGPAVGLTNMGHMLVDRLFDTLSRLDEQVGRLNRLV